MREREGRLFILGVGGSAGNCGHAVNDFRKLCGIEAYAPTDNVSELTARTNDEGWQTVFSEWLKVSRANAKDAILIFSVGGGNLEKNVSPNLVAAIQEAKERGLKVLGIVGRDGGYTKKAGDVVVVIPTVEEVAGHAACRGVSGRGLALPGLASEAAEERHQMVRAVFLDRDGVINANVERDGRAVAPTRLEEFQLPARRRGGGPPPQGGRLHDRRRHQPARRRHRPHAEARPSRRCMTRSARRSPSTTSRSAPMSTLTIATAASRSPA